MNATIDPQTVNFVPISDRTGDAATSRTVVALLRTGLQTLDVNRETAVRLISVACRMLEQSSASSPAADESASHVRGGLVAWQMQRVKAHIETNLNRNLAMTELAAVARLGPSHFRRAFKKCFGTGPHAYLTDRRVRRAQELMLTTDKPLCEIALAVGFSDQAHLTLRFHRAVGSTPGIWRRERAGGGEMRQGLTNCAGRVKGSATTWAD